MIAGGFDYERWMGIPHILALEARTLRLLYAAREAKPHSLQVRWPELKIPG